MKSVGISFVAILLSSSFSFAAEKVIFDVDTKADLKNFSLFFERPEDVVNRPGIKLTSRGIEGKPGDGNFTAYKFANLQSSQWILRVVLQVPENIAYSNSGIYLLYMDPQVEPVNPSPVVAQAFGDSVRRGQTRRQMYGAGPFELDFFSHEVQIIAGTDATIPPENHGAVALYGVDIGDQLGQQYKFNDFNFLAGRTYEMIVVSQGLTITTYARELQAGDNSQNEPQLVSLFRNVTRDVDPIRGGSPVALLLQGFYNDGVKKQLPIFKRITLDQR